MYLKFLIHVRVVFPRRVQKLFVDVNSTSCAGQKLLSVAGGAIERRYSPGDSRDADNEDELQVLHAGQDGPALQRNRAATLGRLASERCEPLSRPM